MVGVGGTYNYEIAGAMAGVTDVLAGTYTLMDARYAQSRPQFTPAARVLATVTSRPEPGTAIVDTGQKAIGIDAGNIGSANPVRADARRNDFQKTFFSSRQFGKGFSVNHA